MLENCVLAIQNHSYVKPNIKCFIKVVDTYRSAKIYDWDQDAFTKIEIIKKLHEKFDLVSVSLEVII